MRPFIKTSTTFSNFFQDLLPDDFALSSVGHEIERVEPVLVIVKGDLHLATMQFVAFVQRWCLVIDKPGIRINKSDRGLKGATAEPKFFSPSEYKKARHGQGLPMPMGIYAIAQIPRHPIAQRGSFVCQFSGGGTPKRYSKKKFSTIIGKSVGCF